MSSIYYSVVNYLERASLWFSGFSRGDYAPANDDDAGEDYDYDRDSDNENDSDARRQTKILGCGRSLAPLLVLLLLFAAGTSLYVLVDHINETSSLPGKDGVIGADGLNGTKGDRGIHCWDLNENGVCDLAEEDTNLDGVCSVLDCVGAAGTAALSTVSNYSMFYESAYGIVVNGTDVGATGESHLVVRSPATDSCLVLQAYASSGWTATDGLRICQTTNGALIDHQEAGKITLRTNGTDRMVIEANGTVVLNAPVLVGASTGMAAGYKFNVKGTTKLEGNVDVDSAFSVSGLSTLAGTTVLSLNSIGALDVTGTSTLATVNAGTVTVSSLNSSGAVNADLHVGTATELRVITDGVNVPTLVFGYTTGATSASRIRHYHSAVNNGYGYGSLPAKTFVLSNDEAPDADKDQLIIKDDGVVYVRTKHMVGSYTALFVSDEVLHTEGNLYVHGNAHVTGDLYIDGTSFTVNATVSHIETTEFHAVTEHYDEIHLLHFDNTTGLATPGGMFLRTLTSPSNHSNADIEFREGFNPTTGLPRGCTLAYVGSPGNALTPGAEEDALQILCTPGDGNYYTGIAVNRDTGNAEFHHQVQVRDVTHDFGLLINAYDDTGTTTTDYEMNFWTGATTGFAFLAQGSPMQRITGISAVAGHFYLIANNAGANEIVMDITESDQTVAWSKLNTFNAGITVTAGTANLQAVVATTLSVTGTSTLAAVSATAITGSSLNSTGTLVVTGTSTMAAVNAAAITGSSLSSGGTLSVTGTSTMATVNAGAVSGSSLSTGGTLGVTGLSSLADVTLTGDLSVASQAAIGSTSILAGYTLFIDGVKHKVGGNIEMIGYGGSTPEFLMDYSSTASTTWPLRIGIGAGGTADKRSPFIKIFTGAAETGGLIGVEGDANTLKTGALPNSLNIFTANSGTYRRAMAFEYNTGHTLARERVVLHGDETDVTTTTTGNPAQLWLVTGEPTATSSVGGMRLTAMAPPNDSKSNTRTNINSAIEWIQQQTPSHYGYALSLHGTGTSYIQTPTSGELVLTEQSGATHTEIVTFATAQITAKTNLIVEGAKFSVSPSSSATHEFLVDSATDMHAYLKSDTTNLYFDFVTDADTTAYTKRISMNNIYGQLCTGTPANENILCVSSLGVNIGSSTITPPTDGLRTVGDVIVGGALTVTGIPTFTSQSVHNSGIDCNGALDVSTTLVVTGVTNLKADTYVGTAPTSQATTLAAGTGEDDFVVTGDGHTAISIRGGTPSSYATLYFHDTSYDSTTKNQYAWIRYYGSTTQSLELRTNSHGSATTATITLNPSSGITLNNALHMGTNLIDGVSTLQVSGVSTFTGKTTHNGGVDGVGVFDFTSLTYSGQKVTYDLESIDLLVDVIAVNDPRIALTCDVDNGGPYKKTFYITTHRTVGRLSFTDTTSSWDPILSLDTSDSWATVFIGKGFMSTASSTCGHNGLCVQGNVRFDAELQVGTNTSYTDPIAQFNGKVTIGTTGLTGPMLAVFGDVAVDGAIQVGETTSNTGAIAQFNGKVIIGTSGSTDSAEMLRIWGKAYVESGTLVTSDERVKNVMHVFSSTGALAQLRQVRPIEFQRLSKDGLVQPDAEVFNGFYAQNLLLWPHTVKTHYNIGQYKDANGNIPNTLYSIDTTAILAHVVLAIQEQAGMHDALAARVSAIDNIVTKNDPAAAILELQRVLNSTISLLNHTEADRLALQARVDAVKAEADATRIEADATEQDQETVVKPSITDITVRVDPLTGTPGEISQTEFRLRRMEMLGAGLAFLVCVLMAQNYVQSRRIAKLQGRNDERREAKVYMAELRRPVPGSQIHLNLGLDGASAPNLNELQQQGGEINTA